MNEKQRTRRIRDELAKLEAELSRQDAELEAFEDGVDPAALEEADQTLDERLESDEALSAFAESLRRVSRPSNPNPNPSTVPPFAVRV